MAIDHFLLLPEKRKNEFVTIHLELSCLQTHMVAFLFISYCWTSLYGVLSHYFFLLYSFDCIILFTISCFQECSIECFSHFVWSIDTQNFILIRLCSIFIFDTFIIVNSIHFESNYLEKVDCKVTCRT